MSELKFTRCPLCLCTAANTKDDLLRHISIHHRDKSCNIVFSCFLCQELLSSYHNLKAHHKIEHGSIGKEIFDLEEEDGAKLFYEQLFLESCLKCPLEDILQFKAAELLYNLRENGNAIQCVINDLITGSNILVEIFLDVVQSKFCQISRNAHGDSISLEEVNKTLNGFRQNSFFEGLQNPKLFAKYLEHKNWLVFPSQIVVARKEVLRKTQSVEEIPVHFGYVVGFLPLLEKILNLPEVLNCIENPKLSEEGTFASPLDGHYYRHHPKVQKYPGQTLAFGSYVDDVNLFDTASTKPLNGRFFYWNLLNLFPELRSNSRAINLLFCGQAEIVKAYGFDQFLEDYIMGIKKLSSDEGVTFKVMGEKRTFHGIHLFSSGDNPASANLGGFKESHFAELLCRQCMGTKPAIYQSFIESDFFLRSKDSHEQHVKEIEEFNKLPTSQQRNLKNPSVAYGVNRRGIFMNIESCDVTKSFPQDLMHDVIHGTLKHEIICLLNDTIIQRKSIDIQTVNNRILKYSKFFGGKTPSAIETKHLQDQNIRQSASETLALARMLPFVLLEHDDLTGGVKSVCKEENLRCFILRLNLLDWSYKWPKSLQ